MKCPVCNRDLAPTLSICPSCGAMMNDTVREELKPRVVPSGGLPPIQQNATTLPVRPFVKQGNPYAVPPPATRAAPPQTSIRPRPVVTAELSTAKTSPTLVEFQSKNTPIPEWRLQMQNAVRQRKGTVSDSISAVSSTLIAAAPLRTLAASTLMAETLPEPIPENADPRLGKAMQRIAESRSSFLPPEPAKLGFAPRTGQAKSFPFDLVTPTPNAVTRPVSNATSSSIPKPTLVAPLKLDTNRLPKLDLTPAPVIKKVEEIQSTSESTPAEFEGIKRIFISAETVQAVDESEQIESDEIEDLAPFAMRFNAGLFDLIIGTVVSMVLLSPFALSGGEWFSISGLLIFVATCLILMFAYLTICVGFFGRTLGMRIFSLEIVDAEENAYPTLQQAAVHSSVYLASLALGGAGFIPMLFNEEKRAIHDLVSGTIIVRQF